MNKEVLVSIIVPAHNADKTISRCLDSLILQTYKELEIIVVDDGSTDETFEIVSQYVNSDQRLKVFRQQNLGVSSARNMGLEKCSGDFVLFVDSDDWVERNCIQIALECFEEYKPDIVLWNLIVERNGESKYNVPLSGDLRVFNTSDIDYLFSLLLTYKSENKGMTNISLAGPVCKMYSRAALNNNRFQKDLDLGEDLLFNLRIYDSVSKVVYINKFLYHYFINSGSLTNKCDLDYSVRKARFVNAIHHYLGSRKNELEEEANIVSYENYLTVIEKYLFVFKGLKYRERIKCINLFDHGLNKKIDFSKIKGILPFLVKNKLYWVIYILGKLSGRYH